MSQVFFEGTNSGVYIFEADGNSPTIVYNGSKGTFFFTGNFGGGTLTAQLSPDAGSSWITDPDFSKTAAGFDHLVRNLTKGLKMRFVLTGASSPELSIQLVQGKGT